MKGLGFPPRLSARVVAGLAVGVVAALATGAVQVALTAGHMEEQLVRSLRGSGLDWVHQRLEATPAAEREALLQEIRGTFAFPLELAPREAAVARAGQPLAGTPTLRAPPEPLLFLPLDGGETFLVAGPLPPPIFNGGMLGGPLLALLALIFTSAAVVAVPLGRRLRALERGIQAIGEGKFDLPVAPGGRDELGDLARSVETMGRRVARMICERDELIQAVAHELGTPLARVRLHLELASANAGPDELRFVALRRELDELEALSAELLVWAEAAGVVLQPRPVQLHELVETLLDVERGPTTGISLELLADEPARRCSVLAAPRLLERSIVNVLRNALRHATSKVVVELRVVGTSAELSIRDDGPGVPVEDRLRVLEPFVRLDRSRSRSGGGAGLGLAIAHRIAVRHGGALWIDEAPEGGAAVTSRWPLA